MTSGDDPTTAAQLPDQAHTPAAPSPQLEHAAGDTIGPYAIRRKLGEGGFGIVYLAEQSEPIRRQVALKVIKPGMDSRAVVARFESERQALAMMDHPCIARVYDAGATATGLPWFAMELVKGRPITDHCDLNKLTVRERIDLFIKVCKGVQHAHAKGLIHRDLKPSNILVEVTDGVATPKVIDFGISKALDQQLTDATLITQAGQFIGTPAYMSPEQAAPGAIDIDTRSDIYALGVVLYELLVGERPFETETFHNAALAEVQRIIREVDPPKPSSRLASRSGTKRPSSERATNVTASRRTELRTLTGVLRRDLDWVVMRCLEKDRARRYEAASALGADLERYLNDEPVLAGPPSAAYRVRKFVRRHRVPVAGATMALVLLLAGLAGTSYGLLEARAQSARADERADEADKATVRAKAAEADATQRAEELAQVAAFQASRFEAIDPATMGDDIRRAVVESVGGEDGAKVAELLAPINFTNIAIDTLNGNIFAGTVWAINEEFADQPRVRAQLLQSVASTLVTLGMLEAADEPQRLAIEVRTEMLGPEDPLTLESVAGLAKLRRADGRLAEAAVLWDQIAPARERVLGRLDTDTIHAVSMQGVMRDLRGDHGAALPYFQEAYERSKEALGPHDPQTVQRLGPIVTKHRLLGDDAGAERYGALLIEGSRAIRAQAIEQFGASSGEALFALISYADCIGFARGPNDETVDLMQEALASSRENFSDDHPFTQQCRDSLASWLGQRDRHSEAEPLMLECIAYSSRVFGDAHPDTLYFYYRLGIHLDAQGKRDDAARAYTTALAGLRQSRGSDHTITLLTMLYLATTLVDLEEYEQAEPLALEFQSRYTAQVGRDGELTVRVATLLARLYEGWDNNDPDGGHVGDRDRWRAEAEALRAGRSDE